MKDKRKRGNSRATQSTRNIAKENKVIDHDFVYKIGPVGGRQVYPDHTRKGDGYEAIIHVYEYPKNVPAGWMNRFKQQRVLISISATPIPQAIVMNNINRSMNEHLSRVHDPKVEVIDKVKSNNKYNELTGLVIDMDTSGETIIKTAVRLHLFERTLEALDNKIHKTLEKLESYSIKAAVFLNEQENEERAIFRPSNRDLLYGRHGTEMPALTFSAGFPFSFSQLNDQQGMALGFTEDGGSFIWDAFNQTDTRTFYNACIFGGMGSGKSTFLKKKLKFLELMGDRTRVLDPVGEFVDIATIFKGKVIDLDGSSDEVLNPLEFSTDIETSLSKAETFLKYIAPALNAHEISLFSDYLKVIYATGEHEPVFSNVLELIEKDLEKKDLSENRNKYLENVQIQVSSIVSKYGSLFNRKSTIDTLREDMVIYTLRKLTSLTDEVKQAQMFNITSSLWRELIILGSEQKRLYESGIHPWDIRKFAIIIDEAHHFLRSSNTSGIDFLVTIEREARKYFAGLIFATHRLSDAISEVKSEHFEKIKALLELTQYKFLLKLDTNELDTIAKVFKNQMTQREIEEIPIFKKGEAIVNISGDSNYKIQIHASDAELELFKGGK